VSGAETETEMALTSCMEVVAKAFTFATVVPSESPAPLWTMAYRTPSLAASAITEYVYISRPISKTKNTTVKKTIIISPVSIRA
jgi:hypothetical protein